MTRAAYQAALDWARDTGVQLWVECDVQFSADGQLICLHDLQLDRTSSASGLAHRLSVEELKQLDFGSWRAPDAVPDERELLTLPELLALVAAARDAGALVGLVIETKHPSWRHRRLEHAVAAELRRSGWDSADAPVQLLTFSRAGLRRFARLLPALPRTLLIRDDLGRARSGRLPRGTRIAGPSLALVRAHPDFVARCRAQGNAVYVWTVNEPEDIALCRSLGVAGYITDYPERVAAAFGGTSQ